MPGNTESDIVWHQATVTRDCYQAQNGHRRVALWFTGLSGAGQSTVAHIAEEALHGLDRRTLVMDGDNVRHGLRADLGISQPAFLKIYCGTSPVVREQCDLAGRYHRAHPGLTPDFTVIFPPHEIPATPELTLKPGKCPIVEWIGMAMDSPQEREAIPA